MSGHDVRLDPGQGALHRRQIGLHGLQLELLALELHELALAARLRLEDLGGHGLPILEHAFQVALEPLHAFLRLEHAGVEALLLPAEGEELAVVVLHMAPLALDLLAQGHAGAPQGGQFGGPGFGEGAHPLDLTGRSQDQGGEEQGERSGLARHGRRSAFPRVRPTILRARRPFVRGVRGYDAPLRSTRPPPRAAPARNHPSMERTLIIFKPDAVQRGLSGRILARFEEKGLKLVAARFRRLEEGLLARHYEAHKARPFYRGLVRFMSESPVLVLVLEGVDAVKVCRKLMGATFGRDAEPGTIRGDFGVSRSYNLIHGSDSPAAAEHEISLFFEADEIVEWQPAGHKWVYDAEDLS